MPYYLAIDQGSHSSRALLFDNQGIEVARAFRDIKLNRKDEYQVEHDAAELLDSVTAVVDELLQGLDENIKQQVAACGIATQRSTVLAWNSRGEAIGPILSWQDVRGAPLVDSLRHKAAQIQNVTGLPLSAHYGASKLRWLLTESEAVKRSKPSELRLSPLISFLLHHLITDASYSSDHSNAQRTQLMDIQTLGWSDELSELFGVPVDYLPECRPMSAHYGLLKNTSIPVTAVCGDQNAAMYGVGKLPEDTALVNLGSGAFVLRALTQFTASGKQLSGIAYSDDNEVQYLREATINGAGSALEWVSKKYAINDLKQRLPGWLATVEKPPLFINTVGGLGSPWWRQGMTPQFIDADNMTGHAALVVAVVESILFMIWANIELMQRDFPLYRLRVSGGLSASDSLCQKLANLCQLPVERMNNSEATARGVAWLAAGRPVGWQQENLAELFTPVLETGLNQRYTYYMATLNQIMEKESDS